jgi:opacity protein-like surface antigen
MTCRVWRARRLLLCERGTPRGGGSLIVLVVIAFMATVSEGSAQGRARLTGYAVLGDVRLDAARTFEAVSESSHTQVFGGGVQVTNLWRFVFVDVGLSGMTIDGERVFIDDGDVQPLGIPLEVSLFYVDVVAGWRHAHGRLSPYVGVGFSRLRYRETSESAPPEDDVTESGTGPLFLAGVDFALSRWVRIGAELRYRRIDGVLGAGGASAIFDEDSAGGLSTALRVSIGL